MPPALQTPTRDSSFASTRWTVVRQAADSQTASQHALSALSELCQIYWRPVYVFLRRQGIPQHDAQDLTPARAPSPGTSTRRGTSRDGTLTQAVLVTVTYALRTAPSPPRSMLRARAWVPAKAPSLIATTRVTRSPDSTLTRTIRGTVSCVRRRNPLRGPGPKSACGIRQQI